jgi:UDP-N-acetylglucosamine 2-epimerase (non-hydrolysing)
MKIVSVVGTRPNFMKLAPLAREFVRRGVVEHVIVHTGQHYDAAMSGSFFDDLDIPVPRHHLSVGAGAPAVQIGAIMTRLDPILEREQPDLMLVYGDVNSTLAAAICAAKRDIRVAHVEAGLRSRDRTMPEEVNRVVTDHLADLLFAPSPDAVQNLLAEGIPAERIHFVGNVMIDVLVSMLPRAREADHPSRLGLAGRSYVIATLHRPSNVDDPDCLRELVGALEELSRETTVLLPLHPRTRRRMQELNITPNGGTLRVLEPFGYLEMLGLMASAALVVTDSGGLQEETTFLGVPCLTVRPNTERPITIEQGTNRLVAPERKAILRGARSALRSARKPPRPAIARWDGRAAQRIAAVICDGCGYSRTADIPDSHRDAHVLQFAPLGASN